jgi:preprotein translocase subunit SecA
MYNPFIQNIFTLLTWDLENDDLKQKELNTVLNIARYIINYAYVLEAEDIMDEFNLYGITPDDNILMEYIENAIKSTPNYWLKGNSLSGKIITINSPEIEAKKTPFIKSDSFRNVGRNDLCPCGSGKKYKKCCLN